MTAVEKRKFLLGGLTLAAAAFLPDVDTGYWLSLGITIAMNAVLATSWAMFSDPTYYIARLTAAFFGLGMYVVGRGIEILPLPVLVIVAGVAGALLSALIGLSTLRLSDVYFVIFTLGLPEPARELVTRVQTTMGTSSDLYVLTDITESIICWELLVMAAIVDVVGWAIRRSRLGFALPSSATTNACRRRISAPDKSALIHSETTKSRERSNPRDHLIFRR